MKLLLISHLLVSLTTGLIGKGKINKQQRFCNVIIALCLPVGGYITVFILSTSNKYKHTRKIEEDIEIEKEIILFTDRVNKERDTNVVPLEETLLINDTKTKRQQLLHALKKDTIDYIDMLSMAVKDEDVETSHYAASAISEIKRNLDLKLQALSVQYEDNKKDKQVQEDYIKVLENYLNTNLLDSFEEKKLLNIYMDVLNNLINELPSESNYNKIIDALFKLRDMSKAEKYCTEYLLKYNSEEAYLAKLKFYYLIKDKNKFNDLFNELLSSSVNLSNKGLNIIRFWLESVK